MFLFSLAKRLTKYTRRRFIRSVPVRSINPNPITREMTLMSIIMKTENHLEVNVKIFSSPLLLSMTWKNVFTFDDYQNFFSNDYHQKLWNFPLWFLHFPDDESDDVEANNNRNFPNASHRNGFSLENTESTDSSYKSYNNFNTKNRESNYHDNKNYDMHKKHRWVFYTKQVWDESH